MSSSPMASTFAAGAGLHNDRLDVGHRHDNLFRNRPDAGGIMVRVLAIFGYGFAMGTMFICMF